MGINEKDHDELEHESYAVVQFNRVSGGRTRLFGSPIRKHGDSITLSIKRCVEIHESGHSWYFPREEYIEVELSAAQFAALLTTMNSGPGVPCTLRRFNGKRIEPPPEDRDLEHERVAKSFANDGEYAQRINGHLDGAAHQLEEALKRPSIRKVDVQNALSRVQAAQREVKANLPFMLGQFREAVEKVKTTVMAEADAWLTSAVQRVGLATLRGETPPTILPPEASPNLIEETD
jgi:hypothetical protein